MLKNNEEDKMSAGKWQKHDYISVVIQILIPIILILVAWLSPTDQGTGKGIPEDTKVTLIGLGLLVPLIINQISMTNDHAKNNASFQDVNEKIKTLEQQLSQTSPMLERAYLSGNERILRFAVRRLDEVKPDIEFAVNNHKTQPLKPREYYNELKYLAGLIKADKMLYGDKFAGEVWAMTGFSKNEWVDPDGYEYDWTQILLEMIDMGIPAKRLCIVDSELISTIKSNSFVVPDQENVKKFPGFLQLMKDYYTSDIRRKLSNFYIINNNSADETILNQHGFFAIKLTNGELYILTGETVDSMGSLHAEAWFDERKIMDFRKQCEEYMIPRYAFGEFVRNNAKPDGFLKFLREEGITLP